MLPEAICAASPGYPDGHVDRSTLAKYAIVANSDHKRVTLTLRAAQFCPAQVDGEILAQRTLHEAPPRKNAWSRRPRPNTRQMLESPREPRLGAVRRDAWNVRPTPRW